MDCVKGQVTFTKFVNDRLWYKCDNGFEFSVPLQDTKNAQGNQPEFLAVDKGIIFMRWIRKELESLSIK